MPLDSSSFPSGWSWLLVLTGNYGPTLYVDDSVGYVGITGSLEVSGVTVFRNTGSFDAPLRARHLAVDQDVEITGTLLVNDTAVFLGFVNLQGTTQITSPYFLNPLSLQAGITGSLEVDGITLFKKNVIHSGTLHVFRDLTVDMTASVGSLAVAADAGVGGNLNVGQNLEVAESIQTLRNLDVAENMAVTGNLRVVWGNIDYSTDDPISAYPGGGQASGTLIWADVTYVTTVASPGDSVTLSFDIERPRTKLVVFNDGANPLDVFPASGSQINDLGVDMAYSLPVSSSAEFSGKTPTQWRTRLTTS